MLAKLEDRPATKGLARASAFVLESIAAEDAALADDRRLSVADEDDDSDVLLKEDDDEGDSHGCMLRLNNDDKTRGYNNVVSFVVSRITQHCYTK